MFIIWANRIKRAPIVYLWSAICLVGWAKAIYWFNSNLEGNVSYVVITELLSTSTWEWMAFLSGLAQMASLAAPCRWPSTLMAGIASWLWICLGVAFVMSHSGAPSWTLYVTMGVLNVHTLIRAERRRV